MECEKQPENLYPNIIKLCFMLHKMKIDGHNIFIKEDKFDKLSYTPGHNTLYASIPRTIRCFLRNLETTCMISLALRRSTLTSISAPILLLLFGCLQR